MVVNLDELYININVYERLKGLSLSAFIYEIMCEEYESRGETVSGVYNVYNRSGIEMLASDYEDEFFFTDSQRLRRGLSSYKNAHYFFYSEYYEILYPIECTEDLKAFTSHLDKHGLEKCLMDMMKKKLRHKIIEIKNRTKKRKSKVLKPIAHAVA